MVIDADKLVFLMGYLEKFVTLTGRYEVPLQNVVSVDASHAQTAFAGAFGSGTGFGLGASFKIPLLPFGGRISTRGGRLPVAFRNPNRRVTVSLKN